MTVLITGGGGFLGAWVVRRLAARGIEMRILERHGDRRVVRAIAGAVADSLDWRVGDVTSAESVRDAASGCESIVHLAALLTTDCAANPVLGAQVNLIGTLHVFEAAKALGIARVAYASSAGVFAPGNGDQPRPITHYGAYKLACEGCARAYWHESGISSIGFRPLIVYGPGRASGLTAGPSIACREAAAGRPYTIGYRGVSDMIFVDDVAAAFEAAVNKPFEGAHAFTLCGQQADMPEIVSGIRQQVPGAAIDWAGPALPMADEITPGDTLAVLGTLPRTSLAEGLARTIEFYRQHDGQAV